MDDRQTGSTRNTRGSAGDPTAGTLCASSASVHTCIMSPLRTSATSWCSWTSSTRVPHVRGSPASAFPGMKHRWRRQSQAQVTEEETIMP